MDLSAGISFSFLITIILCSYSQSSQLYLQPVKNDHAYFTGDNFFVTCFTTDDNIEKLTWTDFESNPISTDHGRIHAEHAKGDQVGLRLVFTNVEIEDAGTYTCSDDQDSVSFDLTVYRAVSFGDTPRVQHAPEGDTGVVLCNVKADPKPVVNWYFEGTKISNDKKYQIHPDNHSLKIHDLTRNDAGEYKCKAFVFTHLSSQIKDFDIKLHVQYVPEIIGEQHFSTYASVGSKKNLTCTITGDPVPIFQWLYDEMIIHNNTKNSVIYSTENSSVLQMNIDSRERFGEYICRASNPLGEKEVVIELKEGNPPPAPTLEVSSDKDTVKLDIKIVEDEDVDNDLRVTGFKVQYILALGSWNSAKTHEFKIGDVYELKNMSYNTQYIFRAAAYNAAGYGNFSNEVIHQTPTLQTAPVVSSSSTKCALSSALFFLIVALL
ncbi:hemicentin-2-like [Argiope bruennichi]|uniref:hemicentin-2-like n=1 Tax=Argiope bruennichi TaxID=94029 RepID=UPI0024943A3A|nr:hemicentin-2-like [Argiope bruennichi]